MFCLLEYDKKKKEKRKQSASIHTHIQWDFVYTQNKKTNMTQRHMYIVDSKHF